MIIQYITYNYSYKKMCLGNSIFNSIECSTLNYINDSFRPDGLNNHISNNYGGLSKPSAKPRKSNPLQIQLSNIPSNLLSNLPSNLPFNLLSNQPSNSPNLSLPFSI